MGDERLTVSLEEFHATARARFGNDPMGWRFVCPSCGHIAAVRDWKGAGAPEGAVAFSCVGRWLGADGDRTFRRQGGPCNYAGGGLFPLNPVRVVGLDQDVHVFALAPAAVEGASDA
jgi:hypothetical protein